MITPKYELNDIVIVEYNLSQFKCKIIGFKITEEYNIEKCLYFLVDFPIKEQYKFCKLFEREIHDWLNSQYIIDIQFVSDVYKYIGEPTCWVYENHIIQKVD